MSDRESQVSESDFLDPNEMVAHAARIQEYLEHGRTLREAMEVSGKTMEEKYRFAHEQYADGDFATAIDMFAYLAILDPYDIRAWYGLGMSLTIKGRVEEGGDCLALTHLMNPTNGLPLYLLAINAYLEGKSDLANSYLSAAGGRNTDAELEKKILRAEAFEPAQLEGECDNAYYLSMKALASAPLDTSIRSLEGQQLLRREVVRETVEAQSKALPDPLLHFAEAFAEQYGGEPVAFAFHYLRSMQLGKK